MSPPNEQRPPRRAAAETSSRAGDEVSDKHNPQVETQAGNPAVPPIPATPRPVVEGSPTPAAVTVDDYAAERLAVARTLDTPPEAQR